jgi:hypothetical protein
LLHSKRRGIAVSLTPEDAWSIFEKQGGCCALTGIKIDFASITINRHKEWYRQQTASLDRIDSDEDYNPKNVRWVHKDINKMRLNHSDETFIKWCCLVATHAGGLSSAARTA